MPRELKVYVTSIGFFDLAIAAPSMKAALAAWVADSNLFHQNFAKEVDDPDVVKASMAHPGVVLKRPVGSTKPFAETSALPDDLVSPNAGVSKIQRPRTKRGNRIKRTEVDPKKASVAYLREERKRQARERKEEAKRAAARQKREAALAKAEEALKQAETEHRRIVSEIEAERDRLDARHQAEGD